MPKYRHRESEVAQNLIDGHWYWDSDLTLTELIKGLTTEKRALCLLEDIANSLRVLRCQNFQDIPHVLKTIRGNTGRIPKKAKGE